MEFWYRLTEEQKQDLDLAIQESEDEKNWVSHEEVMNEAKEWFKK